MAIEMRMTVSEVTAHAPHGHTEEINGREVAIQQHDVRLSAIADADDEETPKWSVWTPSADLEAIINNPEAARYLVPGETYRVVITKLQPQQART